MLGSYSGKLKLPPGIGRPNEAAARVYLVAELGYEIVETNFPTQEGKNYIVAKSDSAFVCIEVNTRTNHKLACPVVKQCPRKSPLGSPVIPSLWAFSAVGSKS